MLCISGCSTYRAHPGNLCKVSLPEKQRNNKNRSQTHGSKFAQNLCFMDSETERTRWNLHFWWDIDLFLFHLPPKAWKMWTKKESFTMSEATRVKFWPPLKAVARLPLTMVGPTFHPMISHLALFYWPFSWIRAKCKYFFPAQVFVLYELCWIQSTSYVYKKNSWRRKGEQLTVQIMIFTIYKKTAMLKKR